MLLYAAEHYHPREHPLKTIARSRAKFIAEITAEFTDCRMYDSSTANMINVDASYAWAALTGSSHARLIEDTDGNRYTVHVHSNRFYYLTRPAAPAAAPAPQPAAVPAAGQESAPAAAPTASEAPSTPEERPVTVDDVTAPAYYAEGGQYDGQFIGTGMARYLVDSCNLYDHGAHTIGATDVVALADRYGRETVTLLPATTDGQLSDAAAWFADRAVRAEQERDRRAFSLESKRALPAVTRRGDAEEGIPGREPSVDLLRLWESEAASIKESLDEHAEEAADWRTLQQAAEDRRRQLAAPAAPAAPVAPAPAMDDSPSTVPGFELVSFEDLRPGDMIARCAFDPDPAKQQRAVVLRAAEEVTGELFGFGRGMRQVWASLPDGSREGAVQFGPNGRTFRKIAFQAGQIVVTADGTRHVVARLLQVPGEPLRLQDESGAAWLASGCELAAPREAATVLCEAHPGTHNERPGCVWAHSVTPAADPSPADTSRPCD